MSADTDLVYNSEESIETPDDVSFPKHVHHLQVRSELTELCRRGLIDGDQADEIYDDWLDGRNA